MDYTQEQRERLFKGILSYVADAKAEDGVSTKIRPSTINRLTGLELDEDRVIKNLDHLNSEFGYLSASYGFTDFHDFYLYAMACEQEEPANKGVNTGFVKVTKTVMRNGKPIDISFYDEDTTAYEPIVKSGGGRKKKDYSKLKQVKRTVTRNGKPTEMTFYEDPNKEDKGDSQPGAGDEQEDTSPKPTDAKELRKASVGEVNERVSTKDLNAIQKMHEQMNGSQAFNPNAGSYQILADEFNNIMGIVGFDYSPEYVTLVFYDKNELVSNFDSRLFFALVNEGLKKGKGIKTKHLGTRTFDIFVEDHGIEVPETKDGDYILEKEELFEVYGYDE